MDRLARLDGLERRMRVWSVELKTREQERAANGEFGSGGGGGGGGGGAPGGGPGSGGGMGDKTGSKSGGEGKPAASGTDPAEHADMISQGFTHQGGGQYFRDGPGGGDTVQIQRDL